MNLIPFPALLILFFTSTLLTANSDFEKKPSVETAFKSINHDIYLIEETKNYCDTNFPDQVPRNTEAYKNWELQYNFFLREMDDNYDKWKSGFNELLQQQFPALDFIARKIAYIEVEQEFVEGGADKCFNFKPSLTRPRSNIELNHEKAISLLRNQSYTNFRNDRSTTGASQNCHWEQSTSFKIAQFRNEGKDKKSQTEMLKALKEEKSGSDKNEASLRIKKYAEMIDQVYEAHNLQPLGFSQYRFSLCERDKNGFKSTKFKQALPALESCQQNSEDFLKLGFCINKTLEL